jgi:hypothetical protein
MSYIKTRVLKVFNHIIILIFGALLISCGDFDSNTTSRSLILQSGDVLVDDMILDPNLIDDEDLKNYMPEVYLELYSQPKALAVIQTEVKTWPNGQVYFLFDKSVSEQSQRTILEVCNSFSNFAKIRCSETPSKNTHSVFVTTANTPCSGYANLGYRPNQTQILHLNISCSQTLLREWLIPHELLHVLGIIHEHQHPDRDKYLRINEGYIQDKFKGNFVKVKSFRAKTQFDFKSVLLYHSGTFAKTINGQNYVSIFRRGGACDNIPSNTLFRNADPNCLTKSNGQLSSSDKALIGQLYR